MTLLFHSPLKTARKSIKQSRHTGAFPDHITPLCLPAPQHHVSTAPRPYCDINLPQNTGLINHLKGSSLSGPMNYRVWLKLKTAAHFQHSDLIPARRWVDKYCSWATVGWTQMKSWDNLWLRLSVGFHFLIGKKFKTYLERALPLDAANQAKNKRIICTDNTVYYRVGTHLVWKHRSDEWWYLCRLSTTIYTAVI